MNEDSDKKYGMPALQYEALMKLSACRSLSTFERGFCTAFRNMQLRLVDEETMYAAHRAWIDSEDPKIYFQKEIASSCTPV